MSPTWCVAPANSDGTRSKLTTSRPFSASISQRRRPTAAPPVTTTRRPPALRRRGGDFEEERRFDVAARRHCARPRRRRRRRGEVQDVGRRAAEISSTVAGDGLKLPVAGLRSPANSSPQIRRCPTARAAAAPAARPDDGRHGGGVPPRADNDPHDLGGDAAALARAGEGVDVGAVHVRDRAVGARGRQRAALAHVHGAPGEEVALHAEELSAALPNPPFAPKRAMSSCRSTRRSSRCSRRAPAAARGGARRRRGAARRGAARLAAAAAGGPEHAARPAGGGDDPVVMLRPHHRCDGTPLGTVHLEVAGSASTNRRRRRPAAGAVPRAVPAAVGDELRFRLALSVLSVRDLAIPLGGYAPSTAASRTRRSAAPPACARASRGRRRPSPSAATPRCH